MSPNALPPEDDYKQMILDCDRHIQPSGVTDLMPYLSPVWREYFTYSGFDELLVAGIPAFGATGPPRASAAEATVDPQLPDELAIVVCSWPVDRVRNPYAAAALASAVNDWIIATILESTATLKAGLVVPVQYPDLAIAEIHRVGDHPGFVQVALPLRTQIPYGNLIYRSVLQAATSHDLRVGLDFGGFPGFPPTATGWPSYFLEEYVGMASIAQTQLTSLICEGAFDELADLRVMFSEVGFAWLPAWAWRANKEWRMLRREVPWLNAEPSLYVNDRVRFTMTPWDIPEDYPWQEPEWQQPFDLAKLLVAGSGTPGYYRLVGSRAFCVPEELLAAPSSTRARILHHNAAEFYGVG